MSWFDFFVSHAAEPQQLHGVWLVETNTGPSLATLSLWSARGYLCSFLSHSTCRPRQHLRIKAERLPPNARRPGLGQGLVLPKSTVTVRINLRDHAVMTSVSIYPYQPSLGGGTPHRLSMPFLQPSPYTHQHSLACSDMSGTPFSYPSSERQYGFGAAPSRSLPSPPQSTTMASYSAPTHSDNSSQSTPASQSLAVLGPPATDEAAMAARIYGNSLPSYSQSSLYASTPYGTYVPSPSQLVGTGLFGQNRPVAKPKSVAERYYRASAAFSPGTASFQPSPLSQSYIMPRHSTSPSYMPFQAMQQVHPALTAPPVDYLFPPHIMGSVRPETLTSVATHLGWTEVLRKRVPRTILLPAEVVRRIIPDLGYLDLIRLSSVNRDLFYNKELRGALDRCPEEEKAACVLEAENNFKQHWPGKKSRGNEAGNFGCFYCFRVRGFEQFEHLPWGNKDEIDLREEDSADSDSTAAFPTAIASRKSSVAASSPRTIHDSPHHSAAGSPPMSQATLGAPGGTLSPPSPNAGNSRLGIPTAGRKRNRRAIESDQDNFALRRIKLHWDKRRFCIECGVNARFYQPGDIIIPNKIGDHKQRTHLLWVCQCYQVHSQLAVPECQECGANCPYSNRQPLDLLNPNSRWRE